MTNTQELKTSPQLSHSRSKKSLACTYTTHLPKALFTNAERAVEKKTSTIPHRSLAHLYTTNEPATAGAGRASSPGSPPCRVTPRSSNLPSLKNHLEPPFSRFVSNYHKKKTLIHRLLNQQLASRTALQPSLVETTPVLPSLPPICTSLAGLSLSLPSRSRSPFEEWGDTRTGASERRERGAQR